MKSIIKKMTVSLLAAIFFFACSDKYQGDYDYLNSETEVSAIFNEETFVSLELATSVAEAFLSVEVAKKGAAKSFANASVETVKDNGNPSMYVVNYPEGGWVIVGASRNYSPVLAYSDEGSFEIKSESEMGGAFLWLEETKEAVRVSSALADTTKARMRDLWKAYETNDFKISESSGAKNYQTMLNRMWELQAQYGSSGWYEFIALEDAEWVLGSSVYQSLMSLANGMGSPPEFTIVGIKQISNTTTVGPLLTTQWHQSSPFNAHVEAHVASGQYAGCVPVAMAQIMKYHGKPATGVSPANISPLSSHWWRFHPASPTVPGWSTVFDWSNMTNTGGSSTPYLIHAAGRAADAIYYPDSVTSSTISKAEKAFRDIFNYSSVTQANHDNSSSATVRNNINSNRPVFMSGYCSNTGYGHAWVCDGWKQQTITTYYSVDLFNGYSYFSYIPPTQPGTCQPLTLPYYYHMNWCVSEYKDGWFIDNSLILYHNGNQYNFQNDRKNLYIAK